MRPLATLLVAAAAVAALAPAAEAQSRRSSGPLILDVRPRSFLDAGRVVAPHSLGGTTSTLAYQMTFMNTPAPYTGMRDRFGEGTLPDRITGPFVGARNPFGPVDYPAPGGFR